MSKYIINSYQTPNVLIDEHLQDLDPYEFTLLAIIIRKTIGWGRAERGDAISVSQFEKLAPKISRRTIVTKLGSLEDKGLVEVVRVDDRVTPNRYRLAPRFYETMPDPETAPDDDPEPDQGSAADAPPTGEGSAGDALGVVQELHQGSAGDALTETQGLNTQETQQQQQGACAPAAVSPDGDMPAAPAEQSGDAPTDITPVVESLRKRGFCRSDAETLVVEHGAERVRLELSRLEWGLRHPAWAAQRRNVPGWIRGSLATEGGYAIPPGFTGPEDRQRRERQRRRKAAMSAAAEKARAEEDARAAAERARREREWEVLPAEVRGDVERVALETLKARDPLTHKLIQGVIDRGDDPRPTGLWDAVQEIRQQLIRERETMGVV